MSAYAAFDVAIADAIRVRPNKRAVGLLRVTLEAMEAMASTEDERVEAAGLRLLLELNDKIGKALADGVAISTLPVAPGA